MNLGGFLRVALLGLVGLLAGAYMIYRGARVDAENSLLWFLFGAITLVGTGLIAFGLAQALHRNGRGRGRG